MMSFFVSSIEAQMLLLEAEQSCTEVRADVTSNLTEDQPLIKSYLLQHLPSSPKDIICL